jgi:hypothetical protein
MYIERNIVARSIFSAILSASHHIIRIERFYGDLSPATKNLLSSSRKAPDNFTRY